jgi:hypothetical protein
MAIINANLIDLSYKFTKCPLCGAFITFSFKTWYYGAWTGKSANCCDCKFILHVDFNKSLFISICGQDFELAVGDDEMLAAIFYNSIMRVASRNKKLSEAVNNIQDVIDAATKEYTGQIIATWQH